MKNRMATAKKETAKSGAKSAKSTAIVPWSEKFAKYAKEGKEQTKNVISGGTSVKFGHNSISVGGAAIPGGKLECVVLGYCAMNAWNEDAYDPDNPQPPDCYAFSVVYDDEEMKPHEKAPMKQHETCKGCAKNEYGTATTGKGKACGNNLRLALLTGKDCKTADGIASAEIATAKISPTNVKHFKAYADMLADEHGRPVWAAVTEIASLDDPKTQIRLEFKLVDLIEDDDVLEALEKRQDKIQETLQTPFSPAAERPAKNNGRGPVGKSNKFAGKGRR